MVDFESGSVSRRTMMCQCRWGIVLPNNPWFNFVPGKVFSSAVEIREASAMNLDCSSFDKWCSSVTWSWKTRMTVPLKNCQSRFKITVQTSNSASFCGCWLPGWENIGSWHMKQSVSFVIDSVAPFRSFGLWSSAGLLAWITLAPWGKEWLFRPVRFYL